MTQTWWAWPVAAVGLCVLSAIYTKLRAPGFRVAGKHVFITGGSTGLGLATAKKYAKAGASVSIVARGLDKLEEAKKEIEEVRSNPETKVFIKSCDVTSFESLKEAIEAANKAHDRVVDHLICCAGVATPGYFLDQDISVFRKSMELNYFGVVNTIKAALPAMVARGEGGRIMIVSSGLAMLSFIGFSQYSSSKYALRGLAEALRNEFKLYNIDVHIFYPGNIDSPGFVEENKIKPEETKTIEGVSEPIHPDKVADSMISGMSNGHFSITNDPLIAMLRALANGVTPRLNTPLELFLMPLLVLIQVGFGMFMDFVVWQSGKKKKKEKTN
ncbi:TPA: hypothetical protein N0F65_004435 [Lagenidium giganteum]|uniref:3-dehydrosphinganine reductase n=1 Tax=Lagenidium giganteum TaxID=4803 RepID=A0AAV2ZBL1_9STRA|nr:TPA: hypothetical protein N0F65_004435 [Lagenidium giganteum]